MVAFLIISNEWCLVIFNKSGFVKDQLEQEKFTSQFNELG